VTGRAGVHPVRGAARLPAGLAVTVETVRAVGLRVAVRVAEPVKAYLEEGTLRVGRARRARGAGREASAVAARLVVETAGRQPIGAHDDAAVDRRRRAARCPTLGRGGRKGGREVANAGQRAEAGVARAARSHLAPRASELAVHA